MQSMHQTDNRIIIKSDNFEPNHGIGNSMRVQEDHSMRDDGQDDNEDYDMNTKGSRRKKK